MKIVEVEWLDAAKRSRWRDRAEFRQQAPSACRSVGYLFRYDREAIVLVQSVDINGDDAVDSIAIPRECVTRYRVIRAGPKG